MSAGEKLKKKVCPLSLYLKPVRLQSRNIKPGKCDTIASLLRVSKIGGCVKFASYNFLKKSEGLRGKVGRMGEIEESGGG
jgi:hypothetical protein